MNSELRSELREAILKQLRPYLQQCARYHIGGDRDLIELTIWEDAEDKSGRIVIRIGILDQSTQLHIPNISFPSSWRGRGDGMRLIETIFHIAREHRYALFITQCTDGFYRYLLETCGASQIDEDTVEVTNKTNLVNKGRLAAREFGDSYKSSYEAAVEFAEMSEFGVYPKDIKIIHGRITPLAGANQGKEIHHAWVEVGDSVFDTSNNQEGRFIKGKFYTQLNAVVDRTYSVAEAKVRAEETGNFGRWD